MHLLNLNEKFVATESQSKVSREGVLYDFRGEFDFFLRVTFLNLTFVKIMPLI